MSNDTGIADLNSEQMMVIGMISTNIHWLEGGIAETFNGGFWRRNFGWILLQKQEECHLPATGWNKAPCS